MLRFSESAFLTGLSNSSVWMIIFLANCVLLFVLVPFLRSKLRKWHLYRLMPTFPKSTFPGIFLGHVEWLLLAPKNIEITSSFFNLTMGLSKLLKIKNKSLFYARIGPLRHFVFVFNAQAAEAVLSSNRNLSKAVEYGFLKDWLGNSLLTANGSHWKKHRKLLTPAFHFEILKMFIPIMNTQLATMRSIIDSKMSSGNVALISDIRPLVSNCVMDIFCQTAMGAQLNVQTGWAQREDSSTAAASEPQTHEIEYTTAIRGFFDLIIYRILRPWLYPNVLFRLSAFGRKSAQYVQVMQRFTNRVISQRKKLIETQLQEENTLEESMKKIGARKRLAFLDLLLVQHLKGAGNEQLSLVDVKEEVDVFMFAGTETTVTALQFALLLIGLNPEKQKLIHAELDAIFGENRKREITLNDIKRMSYLEMALKETMRLYPSITFVGRTVTEEFTCDGCVIPVGTTLFIFTNPIHRDPEVYEQVETFLPERFSPSAIATRNAFAFIPFSAGPRNCIGQRYAMLQMKLFLATLLRQYTLRSITQRDNILFNSFLVTKALSSISIQFTKRNTA